MYAIVCSITAWFFIGDKFFQCLFASFIGLFTAVWEMPELFICYPNITNIREKLLEEFQFKKNTVRGCVYFLLAGSLHFTTSGFVSSVSWCMGMCGVLNIFAAINKRVDESDGLRTNDTGEDEDGEAGDIEERNGMLPKGQFGTF
jgi:hypothetical protein